MSRSCLPEARRGMLKKLLAVRDGPLRIMEVHSGLSGIIADRACVRCADGTLVEFDGLWESSLTDSASKGLPDAEVVGFESRLRTVGEILDVTKKPLVFDGDTGQDATSFEFMCARLERSGVSAVIIEDKVFPKRNSLEWGTAQNLEDPDVFATKIRRGKSVVVSDDFMIIARIESLIADCGVPDALERAETYLDAGADGIMIHSRRKTTDEIFEFARGYRALCAVRGEHRPLVCVPTTYSHVTENELADNGFSIIIYANHQLRAACLAMERVCSGILAGGRCLDVNGSCVSLDRLFDTVGFLDVKNRDAQFARHTPGTVK